MSKFNLNSKQETSAVIKNAFSIKFPFYVFALGILLAFSAFQCEMCEEVTCEEPPYCEIDENEIVYEADVKVEKVICGAGLWENFWLNDGSTIYLQPYSISDEAKSQIEKLNIEIENEPRLRITYKKAQIDGRYDDQVICMAYVGESTPIFIIDIKIIEGNN